MAGFDMGLCRPFVMGVKRSTLTPEQQIKSPLALFSSDLITK
jgi:hypothetical protein